jgi:hypothetical protein
MLIGDSINISSLNDPPPSFLSEDWNLPAGYYYWDNLGGTQFTTLYYSDLLEKNHYLADEYYWQGDYSIYVGVVPVRTNLELENFLYKTMNYDITKKIKVVQSDDLYDANMSSYYQSVKNLAGSDILFDISVFDATSSSKDIYSCLFESEGVIYEHGHGSVTNFVIGSTTITGEDSYRFQFINPLLIAYSCSVQAYHLGECLIESFLKDKKGPVVIVGDLPWGEKQYQGILSVNEKGVWEDLFSGKTIGQAYIDHCKGSWENPHHLFGDPSLVIIG